MEKQTTTTTMTGILGWLIARGFGRGLALALLLTAYTVGAQASSLSILEPSNYSSSNTECYNKTCLTTDKFGWKYGEQSLRSGGYSLFEESWDQQNFTIFLSFPGEQTKSVTYSGWTNLKMDEYGGVYTDEWGNSGNYQTYKTTTNTMGIGEGVSVTTTAPCKDDESMMCGNVSQAGTFKETSYWTSETQGFNIFGDLTK